jgi:hypothetical protein
VQTISAVAVQLACGWATAVASSASAKAAVPDMLSMVCRFIVFLLARVTGIEHPNEFN